MKKLNMSQRLIARMHFKSLLLLTLLTGTASAQQNVMPTIALETPTASGAELLPPSLDAALPPELGVPNMPAVTGTWMPTSPTTTTDLSARSTWTLRQHTTWLLGLKIRSSSKNILEPTLVAVPQVEITSAAPVPCDLPVAATSSPIALVQHSEPTDTQSTSVDATGVQLAVHSPSDAGPVPSVTAAQPYSLNLGPVVSGPAPSLPLEQTEGDSLLQVDLSGLNGTDGQEQSPAESLIEGVALQPPVGFSLNDHEATVAASPSRSKPVSIQPVAIHEGFAPRSSNANQPATLLGSGARDRGPASSSGGSQFSLSDDSQTLPSGPIVNRLSDKDSRDTEQEKPTSKFALNAPAPTVRQAVETSFSDKGPRLESKPVEVAKDEAKTSRSGKPVVLTPPARLAKETPDALPLSGDHPIASTGVDADLPKRLDANESTNLKQVPVKAPTATRIAVEAESNVDKPTESLIDLLIPEPEAVAVVQPKPTVDEPVAEKVRQSPAAKVKPAPVTSVAKTQPLRAAPKPSLEETNPIAMQRPLIKAASVVPSSHEVPQVEPEVAEFAKVAAKMQDAIRQKFPNLRVKISCNEDGLILSGNVATNVEASKVLSFVRKSSLCPVADRITTSQ